MCDYDYKCKNYDQIICNQLDAGNPCISEMPDEEIREKIFLDKAKISERCAKVYLDNEVCKDKSVFEAIRNVNLDT